MGPWHGEQYNRNNKHCSRPEFLGRHGCDDEKSEKGFLKSASPSEYRQLDPRKFTFLHQGKKVRDLVLFSISQKIVHAFHL